MLRGAVDILCSMIAEVEVGHATFIAIHETVHNKSMLILSRNLEENVSVGILMWRC